MASDNDNTSGGEIAAAARSLHARLAGRPWVQAVGIGAPDEHGSGAPRLIVYCSRRLRAAEKAGVPHTWQGSPVELREIGRTIPAG